MAGNFHFAPGKSFQNAQLHVHDMDGFEARRFNVSHEIYSLSFGAPVAGAFRPLEGTAKYAEEGGGINSQLIKIHELWWQNQAHHTDR